MRFLRHRLAHYTAAEIGAAYGRSANVVSRSLSYATTIIRRRSGLRLATYHDLAIRAAQDGVQILPLPSDDARVTQAIADLELRETIGADDAMECAHDRC